MRPSSLDSATISRHYCSPCRPQPPHAREFVASSSIQNEVVMATPTRPRFVGGPGQDQALLLPGLESLLELLFKWSYSALCNFPFHAITCYARSGGCSGGDLGGEGVGPASQFEVARRGSSRLRAQQFSRASRVCTVSPSPSPAHTVIF